MCVCEVNYELSLFHSAGGWHYAWNAYCLKHNKIRIVHADAMLHDSILCCYQHAVKWAMNEPSCPLELTKFVIQYIESDQRGNRKYHD